MNVAETTKLCENIATAFPHQKFADETPAVWARVLADYRLKDAVDAALDLCGRQNFVSPADIITGIRALRAKRLEGIDRIRHLADGNDEWRALIRRVGDGDVEGPSVAVENPDGVRAVEASIRDVFPRPPRPLPIDHVRPALPPAPTVSPEQSRAMEAERARQEAELRALIDAEHEGAAS